MTETNRTSQARIVVVDDEPGMREALAEVIRRAGHRSEECASAEAALADGVLDGADLVISDLRMPGMDGLAFLERLQARRPDLPVVMITAHGTIETAVEAMKRGAFDFVMKPFRPHDIESAVRRALAAKPERSPAAASGAKPCEVIAADPRMLEILDLARTVARSQATVLLQGESGTGKEVLARFLHAESPRGAGPFVAVNCAALPEGLLESELFGHERGAFTGATRATKGKFELADGGTILLDEISEIPPTLQAKLLRVLQEREVDPVGARAPVPVDIRVIATTNRDLAREVEKGRFREDLFFRLNVIPIHLPPLRERPGDLDALAPHLVGLHARRMGRHAPALAESALARLRAHRWPGNVRELDNVIERSVLLARGERLDAADLRIDGLAPGGAATPSVAAAAEAGGGDLTLRFGVSIAEMERRLIEKTLDEVSSNRTRAAEVLGISVRTLRNKLREYRKIDEAR